MLDTDVVAAAVLAESSTGEQAARLLAGKWDFAAPSHWKAEFANVIWKAVQLKRIRAEEIDAIFNRAGALHIESVDRDAQPSFDGWRNARIICSEISGYAVKVG